MNFKKIVALALIFSGMLSSNVFAAKEDYEYYDSITNIISNIYIDPEYSKSDIVNRGLEKVISENPELTVMLLKASLESLDPYSEMFTAEEMSAYINTLNRTIYGIGVVMTTNDDYVTVERCIEGGSAQKAGIMAGDKFVSVDGVNVAGMTTGKVKTYILGELGTDVTVTVLRDGKELTFTMQRCEVHDITVTSSVLKGDIGYIVVESFSEETANEFEQALAEMKNLGIKKIILDLRNNPGGYTDAAVKMAQLIVPEGVIIKTEFRNEDSNEIYKSTLKEKSFDFCVLINGNTASSAEILASAIQDSGAGALVGDTTYGKGVIQNMFSLPGGMGMKITTGKYITRNGAEINDVGIKPDYVVLNEVQRYDTSKLTPMDYKTKWTVGAKGEGIVGAKERLYLLGYNVDIFSDEYTEEELAAVTRFQQDHGLYAYGVIDITTQTRLENETYALDQEIDNQFKYAYEYFGGVVEEDATK